MFHSGGREDIDVRMLGQGRPFILEFLNAKKTKSVTPEALFKAFKSDLCQIHDLKWVNIKHLE